MKVIVLFAVLVISVSAYSERVFEAAEGYNAPSMTIENSDTTLSLADMKGRYVIVTFWSSADADSRLRAYRYDEAAKLLPQERFCLLSVNFDRSERLFREIVRRDNLSAENHIHVDGSQANRIIHDYRLTEGFKSLLIDPKGRIVAMNPSIETLTKMSI
ncbi:thioredoxin family protein [Paramuribaculum intestinale]|nr:thioredoxin family protein [Paramuribaculum intestinale]MBJ2185800.1 thioredoxin family protein [Muribaculaceae bacterium]MCX4329198.1 thioredoxin family protein [Paramuribaculum intestinale]